MPPSTFFTSPLMLRIITMSFSYFLNFSLLQLSDLLIQILQIRRQSAQRLVTGYEPLGKRAKDMERLKEEVNVAFEAGRLNEADGRVYAKA